MADISTATTNMATRPADRAPATTFDAPRPHRSHHFTAAPRSTWIGNCVGAFAAVSILISTSAGLFPSAPEVVSYLWRAAQILLILLGLSGPGNAALSKRSFSYFSVWLGALLIVAIANFDQTAPWLMLVRNALLVAVFCVSYQTRSRDLQCALEVMLKVVLWGGLALVTLTALPLLAGGWSWEESRQLKAEAQSQRSQLFNATMFALALCIGLHRSRGAARVALVLYFCALCILTSTRTPLVALLTAMLVPQLTRAMSGKGGARSAIPLLIGLFAVALPLGLVLYLTQSPDPEIARTLAGRLFLWQAGVEQWLTAPLLGDSGTAFREALNQAYSKFLFLSPWEADVLYDIESGGFHSIWIQALATTGLVGATAVLISYLRLIRDAIQLPTNGAVLVVFLCLARSFTEYSGLFSGANAPLDLLCVGALAYAFNEPRRLA